MFWRLTPRRLKLYLDAGNRRLRREHNDRMVQAWWIAVIPNSKKPVKLQDLLIDADVRPKARDWRELKAALLWAMPPKGNA